MWTATLDWARFLTLFPSFFALVSATYRCVQEVEEQDKRRSDGVLDKESNMSCLPNRIVCEIRLIARFLVAEPRSTISRSCVAPLSPSSHHQDAHHIDSPIYYTHPYPSLHKSRNDTLKTNEPRIQMILPKLFCHVPNEPLKRCSAECKRVQNVAYNCEWFPCGGANMSS